MAFLGDGEIPSVITMNNNDEFTGDSIFNTKDYYHSLRPQDEMSYSVPARLFDLARLNYAKHDPNFVWFSEKIPQMSTPLQVLTDDLFVGLFRYDPQLKTEKQIKPTFLENRKVVQKLIESDEFKNLHRRTRGDPVFTAIATMSVVQQFLKEHAPQVQKWVQNWDKQTALEEDKQQLQNQKHQLEKNITLQKGQLSPGDKQQLLKRLRQVNQGLKKNEEDRRETFGALKEASDALTNKENLKQVFQQSEKEVDEQDRMETLMPGMNKGQIKDRPLGDRMKLARALQQGGRIKEVFKLLGNFSAILSKSFKSKLKQPTGIFSDVILGNDLEEVFPSEFLYLMMPETEILFLKNFAEGELLQSLNEQREPLGRGPFIICVDISGSMDEKNRDMWSKAIALAFLSLAQLQHRRVSIILFESEIHKRFDLMRDGSSDDAMRIMLEVARTQTTGGTKFEPPLDAAFSIVKEEKAFKRADIVIITDGEANIGEKKILEYQHLCEHLDVCVISVLIAHKREPECLAAFTSKRIIVSEELDKDVGRNIIETVI